MADIQSNSDDSSSISDFSWDLYDENGEDGEIIPFNFEPRINRVDENAGESDVGGEMADEIEQDEPGNNNANNGGDGDRVGNTDWCLCGFCDSMPTERESLCCREVNGADQKRISEDPGLGCVVECADFSANMMHEVLANVMWIIHHVRGDAFDDKSNRSMRWVAYRMYIAWIYKRLGKRIRKVIPSCVVNSIRARYPEADGNYEGFHEFDSE